MGIKKFFLIIALAIVAQPSFPARPAPHSQPVATLIDGLGTYSRKISTDSPLAQKFFDQGLRLTYGYYFPEAISSFQEAQRHDPNHPMIYWGMALAMGPNPNSRFLGFPDDPLREGHKAISAARAGSSPASPAERALIETLYVRFNSDTYPDRTERDQKYIAAACSANKTSPQDQDAAFLCADAVMTQQRWSYWSRDGRPLNRTRDAVAALEHLLRLNPNHPGAVHLYIHLFESSAQPERALPQADRLESLMPKAGHVVHMPSHIYIRVGHYDKAIASNERSLDADRVLLADWGENSLPALGTYGMSHRTHARHARDFLRFAAVLQGNYARAIAAGRAAAAGQSHMGTGGVHRLHSTVWLIHKVFGKWDAVLAEPAPAPGSPYLDGLFSYARGSAFVGKRDFDRAQAELEQLRKAAADPALKNVLTIANPAPLILELAGHGLAGELAMARRNYDAAVQEFAAAVRLQDTLNYIEPPDWGQSMRLYLGAALLKARRPRQAEQVYREDLREFRENGWALFGLWESVRDQRKTVEARRIRQQFDRSWKDADVTLPAAVF